VSGGRLYEGFLPGRHPIDAYGNGGFRFAGMSHRGSILALPSGIHAWAVGAVQDLTSEALRPVAAEAADLELLLLGTGREVAHLPEGLGTFLRAAGIRLDTMQTGAAARTYNVLLAENRKVGAALIAVD
jgi:uncharacterized protein